MIRAKPLYSLVYIVSIACFSTALFALSACDQTYPEKQSPTDIGVLETMTVTAETAPKEYLFEGVVEATNQSTVSAQTQGRIAELPFDVGDYVPKGAVIVRIRGKEPIARQEQAIAAVNEAHAAYKEAKIYLERAKPLFERGMLSQSDMDQVTANFEKTKARYDSAQAAAGEAEAQLEYTTVAAPYAGVVTERLVELGETVVPGTRLMSGFSLENLRVTIDIPQEQIGALREHRQARIIFPDSRSIPAGEMTFFPYADPKSHTVKVRVGLPDAGRAIYPGMLVKIAFVADQRVIFAVPKSSIAHRSEVTGIYVQHQNDNTRYLEFRQIKTGDPLIDGRIPILSGISSGEQIVLDTVAATAALKAQQHAQK